MTISYHMQFDTIDDQFVPYAESYEDSTFILILHHIQINDNNKLNADKALLLHRFYKL
jgi:hypothetical protein